MNSLLTVCACDSLLSKVCGTVGGMTTINEAETNSIDGAIVGTICCAVVTIVAIAAVAFLLWKLMEIVSKYLQEGRKREWAEEDRVNKQHADLQDKLVDFRKKLCDGYTVDEEGKRINKDGVLLKVDDKENESYASLLKELLTEISPKKKDEEGTSQQH